MTYLIVLVMVAIALALLWAWWSGRIGRDPAGSVDHFHRALAAMEPGERGPDAGVGADGRPGPDSDEGRPDGDAVGGGRGADGAKHVDADRSHGRER